MPPRRRVYFTASNYGVDLYSSFYNTKFSFRQASHYFNSSITHDVTLEDSSHCPREYFVKYKSY